KLLEMKRAGFTLMVVEQNATRALAIADRGYVLELGKNRFEGPGQRLLADPEVKRLYLGGGGLVERRRMDVTDSTTTRTRDDRCRRVGGRDYWLARGYAAGRSRSCSYCATRRPSPRRARRLCSISSSDLTRN